MTVEVFDGRDAAHNDHAYRDWVQSHSEGYIINTHNGIDSEYMALHRTSCNIITDLARYEPGAYTERNYAKICGDSRSELVDWMKEHGRPNGSFTSEGCHCLR
jgi:hypothetical protein